MLRLFQHDAKRLGIDRGVEVAVSRAAAAIGLGAEVVEVLNHGAGMVMRYLPGSAISPERMREDVLLQRVAKALLHLHSCPHVGGTLDPFEIVNDYHRTALELGVDAGEDFRWGREIADRIRAARGPWPVALCHGDLLNGNFIDDGAIRIVDWEYAGMGDPLFDLANFSVNHALSEGQEAVLLRAYAGRATKRDLAIVRLYRFMSAFREAMWSRIQQAISNLDCDYEGNAGIYFARMREISEDPRFPQWLVQAVREPKGRSRR